MPAALPCQGWRPGCCEPCPEPWLAAQPGLLCEFPVMSAPAAAGPRPPSQELPVSSNKSESPCICRQSPPISPFLYSLAPHALLLRRAAGEASRLAPSLLARLAMLIAVSSLASLACLHSRARPLLQAILRQLSRLDPETGHPHMCARPGRTVQPHIQALSTWALGPRPHTSQVSCCSLHG